MIYPISVLHNHLKKVDKRIASYREKDDTLNLIRWKKKRQEVIDAILFLKTENKQET